MKRTSVIACILATLFAVAATTIWATLRSNNVRTRLPVTLIGYTNDVTGITTALYADTNVSHVDFAVFRIDNSTTRYFFCYIGPVFSKNWSVQCQPSNFSGDFNLAAGESVRFAVPVPDGREKWQCAVVLCHTDQGQSRARALVAKTSRLIGMERTPRSWVAVSEEIVK